MTINNKQINCPLLSRRYFLTHMHTYIYIYTMLGRHRRPEAKGTIEERQHPKQSQYYTQITYQTSSANRAAKIEFPDSLVAR